MFYTRRVVDIPDGKPKWTGLNEKSELIEDSPAEMKAEAEKKKEKEVDPDPDPDTEPESKKKRKRGEENNK